MLRKNVDSVMIDSVGLAHLMRFKVVYNLLATVMFFVCIPAVYSDYLEKVPPSVAMLINLK